MIHGTIFRGQEHTTRKWQSQPCDWVLEHDPTGTIRAGAEFGMYDIKYGSWGDEQQRAWAVGTAFRNRLTGRRIVVEQGCYDNSVRLVRKDE